MYCLKNTLHSFFVFVVITALEKLCVHHSVADNTSAVWRLTEMFLDLSWMCCDVHVVCSFWLISPLIKALCPSDPCRAFHSLLSPCFPPSTSLFHSCLTPSPSPSSLPSPWSLSYLFTYFVPRPSLPVCLPCLHILPSSIFPSTLPVVPISGENHQSQWRSATRCCWESILIFDY